MDGPRLSFRALKPIAKDEEVFISYIEVTNPFARRQHELKERYFFTCKCSKCKLGPTQKEDKFIIPPSQLPAKWKETADIVAAHNPHFKDSPEDYVGEDADSKRVAVIQAAVFQELEEARSMSDPSEAIKKLEGVLRKCYQTKLWPVHRQPY